MDDRMRVFVTNYRLNLYDCHEHDTLYEYRTGLRQLFEVVRYGRNKDELLEVIAKNREAYSSMDSDTRELLEAVAKVRIPESCKIVEEGKEMYNMCKAFEDYRLEGKQEGRQEHLVTLVCKKMQKGMETVAIAEMLEENQEVIERIVEIQRKLGSFDVKKICEIMRESFPDYVCCGGGISL